MIPTPILFGLVFGRWWRAAIPIGGAAWAALLVSDGLEMSEVAGGAALAVANTAFGVLLFQALWVGVTLSIRWMRQRSS